VTESLARGRPRLRRRDTVVRALEAPHEEAALRPCPCETDLISHPRVRPLIIIDGSPPVCSQRRAQTTSLLLAAFSLALPFFASASRPCRPQPGFPDPHLATRAFPKSYSARTLATPLKTKTTPSPPKTLAVGGNACSLPPIPRLGDLQIASSGPPRLARPRTMPVQGMNAGFESRWCREILFLFRSVTALTVSPGAPWAPLLAGSSVERGGARC